MYFYKMSQSQLIEFLDHPAETNFSFYLGYIVGRPKITIAMRMKRESNTAKHNIK